MSLIVASQIGPEFDALARAHPAVARIVPLSPEEAPPAHLAAEVDALIVRPGPAWRRDAARSRPQSWPGRLQWVHSTSAGVDYYPEWIREAPWFSCGRGVASHQVADYVLGAIYARVRDFAGGAVRRAEDWRPVPQGSLVGRKVAILGLGSIGEAVAHRLLALGAQPVGVRRSVLGEHVTHAGAIPLAPSIAAAIADADDIVVALPATPETRGLVDAALLAQAKPGAHLVNIARGSIVVQPDLLAALDSGQLGHATLDVTDPEPLPPGHPLYSHPRVWLTPHISSNWQTILPRLHHQILDNLDRVARGVPPQNLVDPARGY